MAKWPDGERHFVHMPPGFKEQAADGSNLCYEVMCNFWGAPPAGRHYAESRNAKLVDAEFSVDELEEEARDARHVLIFLSDGYFDSLNCMRELRAAYTYRKPVIVVRQKARMHGGLPLADFRRQCRTSRHVEDRTEGTKLEQYLFEGRDVIDWERDVSVAMRRPRCACVILLLLSHPTVPVRCVYAMCMYRRSTRSG